jgi:hypothetical protein
MHIGALRFAQANIPPQSEILSARLQISLSTTKIQHKIDGVLHGEATGNAANFLAEDRNIVKLPRTQAAVAWTWPAGDYGLTHTYHKSPDLNQIVQEIVDRSDWAQGNALALIYSSRVYHGQELEFVAFEAASPNHAKLEITYATDSGREPVVLPPTEQEAPVAHETMFSTLSAVPVTVALSASDDGLPDPPAALRHAILSLPDQGALEDTSGMPITEPTLLRETNQVVYVPTPGYVGQDAFAFRAHDRGRAPWGGASETAFATVFVKNPVTQEYQVCASEEDASGSGPAASLDIYGPTLKVGVNSSGIRFRNVDVPQGSAIASAHLRIHRYSGDITRNAPGTIYGETSDNALDFQTGEQGLLERPRTEWSAPWPWGHAHFIAGRYWFDSPDIGKIVQTIVDRPGWSEGNAIVILYLVKQVSHSQDFQFFSFDNGLYPRERAPKLEISYAY